MGLFPLRSVALSLIAWQLVVSFVWSQQPAGGDVKVTAPAVMSAWLDKLQLSPEQKAQIQIIARDHDAQFAAAWNRFGGSYQATLRMEATVLATIEDNLTEAQLQQVREQRKKLFERGMDKPAVGEGEAGPGVALTAEQEALGRKIQEKFQARLSALGSEVQLLHNRLLSIEMNKLVEIEKVLTKEQRLRLSAERQAAVMAAVNDANTANPTKPQ